VTVIAASEADWHRATRQIALRMSGNPPRRNREEVEHL
jgi:hypothetical protein